MLISVENTPNPLSLKFIPPGLVSEEPVEITSYKEAEVSPLAKDLFKIEGVNKVFLGQDFITVTIENEKNWHYIKPQIVACISDYYVNKIPYINYDELKKKSESSNELSEESLEGIEKDIKELIEERIRPAIIMDGGDVIFKKFENGKVYLQLLGACSGCPSSGVTLKNGIENMLKYFIPEVKEVIAVKD